MARKIVNILGINFDSTPKRQLLTAIAKKFDSKAKFRGVYITTPNPEIVLASTYDPSLREIINNSFVKIADGVGILWAERYLSNIGFIRSILEVKNSKLELIKGRELMLDLLNIAEEYKLKVFFLGAIKEVNLKAMDKIKKEYPKVVVKGSSGPVLNKVGEPINEKERDIEKNSNNSINNFSPDILFVAFGAPKQEKWIAKNLPSLNVKLAMTVGGALDFYTGKAKLPPKWIEDAGIEWLWRLINDPKRFMRILNATVIFPLKLILDKKFS